MLTLRDKQDLQILIDRGKPILMDFYADWCQPCQKLAPIISDMAKKYEDDFSIVKINIEQNDELRELFDIQTIPTLLFMKNGNIKERLVGMQSTATLESKIQTYI